MATLTSQTIAGTYLTLLKLTSAALDGTGKYIEDAAGTDSVLSLSTSKVGIGNSVPTALLTAGAITTLVTDGSTAVTPEGVNVHITEASKYAMGIKNADASGDGLIIQAGDASDDYALNIQKYDGGTDLLALTGAGLLGIGTSTPYSILNLSEIGTGTTPILAIDTWSGTTAAASGYLDFRRSRGTTEDSFTEVEAADKLGDIRFFGADGDAKFVQAGSIRSYAVGTTTDDRVPGEMQFWTSTDAGPSVLTQRLTITSAGLVGIGLDDAGAVVAPTGGLQVDGDFGAGNPGIVIATHKDSSSAYANLVLLSEGGNKNGSSRIVFADDDSVSGGYTSATAEFRYNHGDNTMRYTSVSTADSFIINNSGNIGLGTTAFDNGVRCIAILNGTDPGGTTTNTATFFAASGEMNYTDASGASATLDSLSDERLKDNITVIPDALSRLAKLKGITFNYVSYEDSSLPFKDQIADDVKFSPHKLYGDNTRVGVIAQDVEEAYDGLNITNDVMELPVESMVQGKFEDHVQEVYGKMKKVRIETLVPLLIEAVKELSAKVTALENA